MNAIDFLLFGIYPYICLAVFFIGSWLRYDHQPYTWKSDSSQLLRRRGLRIGSTLFHIGILFLFFGHLVGMLTPHALYEPFMSAGQKQWLAMTAGGIAGVIGLLGLTILLIRRLGDLRIRHTSSRGDILIVMLLWAQFVLGLGTVYFSAQHTDGAMMVQLASWAQSIVTFQSDAVSYLVGVPALFKLHMFLGMTVFLVFPFTRLVHVWSGFGALFYLRRPYQLVRSKKMRM